MATDQLSMTLSALADPTRREMLGRLSTGEMTVSELSEPFDLSPPGITKHLKVLERAGLVERSRRAQWRPCRLRPEPLRDVSEWVDHYRKLWEERFDRLDEYLQQLQTKAQKEPDNESDR